MLPTHSGEKLPQEAPGLRRSPGAHLGIHPRGDIREEGGGPATHPGGRDSVLPRSKAPEALLWAFGRCGWHI